MKIDNEIRRYLAIATQVACETDEPSDDQLDSIVAAAACAIAIIRSRPRGAASFARVTRTIQERLGRASS